MGAVRSVHRDPLLVAQAYFADKDGVAYVVGGRVRDALLGRPTMDTDLVVGSSAWHHGRAIADAAAGSFVGLGRARDIARVVWPAEGRPQAILDLARMTGPDLDADLRARDFTVNAMAVPLATPFPPAPDDILDPTGGLRDLQDRIIRMTAPDVFEADPLRLLRAVRLAAELGFKIEAATQQAISERAERIRLPAAERVREELLKLLGSEGAARQVEGLDELGLLRHVLPEMVACQGVTQSAPHVADVYGHTVAVVGALERIECYLSAVEDGQLLPDAWRDALEPFRGRLAAHLAEVSMGAYRRSVWLRLGCLLHDVGKPAVRTVADTGRVRFIRHEARSAELARLVAERLRLGGTEAAYLGTVVRHHLRPFALSRIGGTSLRNRAVYRYFRDTGEAGVDVVLLALADSAAKARMDPAREAAFGEVVRRLFTAWFDEREKQVAPTPLVSGSELMPALGLAPGPEVGRLLAAIREAQAAGEVRDADEAIELARRLHATSPEVRGGQQGART